MELHLLDGIIFIGYFLLTVLVGLIVAARNPAQTTTDYFLASKKLPWYAVGASFVASNISTEHFIGMVGWGFLYGMGVATWEWGAAFTFSILLWIFLPYYWRGNVATMPQFLEIRFNRICRGIFAVVSIIGMVVALLGAVMYAGAKAVNVLFPDVSIITAIFILALATGLYTIYGGLLAVVWTDCLQYCLLMIGGTIVTIYGLYYVGGLGELVASMPEKFIMIFPPTHETLPWTGLVGGLTSVGIWYGSANQFMVQRCLGARSEWDARMGVIMGMFSKVFLPLIVVIPGLIAYHLFQDRLSDGDQSWPFLVHNFLPAGLVGLVMAGLASAIMSTLSSSINSSSTIATLDIYQLFFRPNASQKELTWFGRFSGIFFLLVGIGIAILLAQTELTIFGIIQRVFFYVAAPVAAVFLIGILWPRATSAAATSTLIIGFALIPLVRYILFPKTGLEPYDSFTHHTFVIFVTSLFLMISISLFTRPKPREQLRGVIWDRSALTLPPGERKLNRGLRNFALWWSLSCLLCVGLFVYCQMLVNATHYVEAEASDYQTSSGAAVVQDRSEVPNFNLWSGMQQVLFTPTASGAKLTFKLEIEKPGRYRIAAIVTRGPQYGRFRATVNEQPATLSYTITRYQTGAKRYQPEVVRTQVFDAAVLDPDRTEPEDPFDKNLHVLERIDLGVYELNPGENRIALEAVEIEPKRSQIGIDQWILTRVQESKPSGSVGR
jgi:SSS family solute:Na+ symporter